MNESLSTPISEEEALNVRYHQLLTTLASIVNVLFQPGYEPDSLQLAGLAEISAKAFECKLELEQYTNIGTE